MTCSVCGQSPLSSRHHHLDLCRIRFKVPQHECLSAWSTTAGFHGGIVRPLHFMSEGCINFKHFPCCFGYFCDVRLQYGWLEGAENSHQNVPIRSRAHESWFSSVKRGIHWQWFVPYKFNNSPKRGLYHTVHPHPSLTGVNVLLHTSGDHYCFLHQCLYFWSECPIREHVAVELETPTQSCACMFSLTTLSRKRSHSFILQTNEWFSLSSKSGTARLKRDLEPEKTRPSEWNSCMQFISKFCKNK